MIRSVEEVNDLLKGFIKDFHETAHDIFKDIIEGEDINAKNDEASILLREQGNKLYQAKQFKVLRYYAYIWGHKVISLYVRPLSTAWAPYIQSGP